MTAFLATLHDLRYVIAAALLIWAAAWTIAKVYAWSCAEVDRMVSEALDEAAADFAEPTRAQVEVDMRDDAAGWERLLAAVEGIEPTPIYNATVRHIAHHAAASIEDEWAEMNGGAS